MKLTLLTTLLLLLGIPAEARDGRELWEEPNRELPPGVRWYLEQRDNADRFGQDVQDARLADSQGVRLIGKWGRGPANRITGRDSLVFMSLGSEVAVFNCADARHPQILSEIQCRGITGEPVLKDSYLLVGVNGLVDVFNIADPSRPRFVCRAPVAGADLAIEDSLCYVLGVDSLYIYDVSNPADFRRVGACRDSGYSIAVDQGFVYLCDRWGLYVIDATDPSRPRRACTLTGQQTGAAWVENGYCYYTETGSSTALAIANVTDPYHPTPVGRRTGIGGYDIYKISFYVYLPGFTIVDVSIPANIGIIGTTGPGGNTVWTRSPFSYSFLAAGYDGLRVINISDPVHPVLDTTMAGAFESWDICVDGGAAYVAGFFSGMPVLDVSDATRPTQCGAYDTAGQSPRAYAVAARDSFAYLMTADWSLTYFRTIDVSNPSRPTFAGTCGMWNSGRAVVLRDTLAYVAEDYHFEIFSIANPRAPRLVGSCGSIDVARGLAVRDTLAIIAGTGWSLFNVANPATPRLVANRSQPRGSGVAIRDTRAYFVHSYDSLCVWTIADPDNPGQIRSVPTRSFPHDVAIRDSQAFVGGRFGLQVFRLFDPAYPEEVGYYTTPDDIWRVACDGHYVYAACFSAGVCIFETTQTSGVIEPGKTEKTQEATQFSVHPNPASGELKLSLPAEMVKNCRVQVRDPAGRVVPGLTTTERNGSRVDIRGLAEGCYFVEVRSRAGSAVAKFVKTRR